MNIKLIYRGQKALFCFKMDWVPGQSRSLAELYDVWGHRCPVSNAPDTEFLKWFHGNFMGRENPNDWVFIQESTTHVKSSSSSAHQQGMYGSNSSSSATNSTTLESSVQVSSSLQDAQNKLVASRKVDSGTIQRSPSSSSQSFSDVEKLKMMDPPGTQVLNGDMLDSGMGRQHNISTPNLRGVQSVQAKEQGYEVVGASAPITRAEEQRMSDNRFADLSNNFKVLSTKDIQSDGKVHVIHGDINYDNSFTSPQASSQQPHILKVQPDNLQQSLQHLLINAAQQQVTSQHSQEDVRMVEQQMLDASNSESSETSGAGVLHGTRNQNFTAYSQVGTSSREITIADIVNNPDVSHAKDLVNACKNTRTLKLAREACYVRGNQQLMEIIDRRLNNLPMRSM